MRTPRLAPPNHYSPAATTNRTPSLPATSVTLEAGQTFTREGLVDTVSSTTITLATGRDLKRLASGDQRTQADESGHVLGQKEHADNAEPQRFHDIVRATVR